MGTPKSLLRWRGTTLLGYAVSQAREAGAEEVIAVVGSPTTQQLAATIVVNPDPATGRSASIRLGAAALREAAAAVVVQSVDQPVVAAALRALFEAVEHGAEIAQPVYRGHRGHPVCVSGALVGELKEVDERTQGLRAVVRAHTVTEVEVDDESVTWNLNDPAAYAAAERGA
jgi:CTP:molybdopterin cytidylyltransferase MocA